MTENLYQSTILKLGFSRLQIRCFRHFLLLVSFFLPVFGAAGEPERPSSEQKISRLVLHGARSAIAGPLVRTLSLEGKTLEPDWIQKTAKTALEFYARNGFLFASVDSMRMNPVRDALDLHIWIREGRPVRVGQVSIQGLAAGALSRYIPDVLTAPGEIFREEMLKEDIGNVLSYLGNSGFPLSSVSVSRFSLSGTGENPVVDIVLSVDPGELVRIDTVRIQGNPHTRSTVILREGRIRAGELYRHDRIVAVKSHLERLGYFKRVEDPEVFFRGNKASVLLKIEEGKTGTLDGMAGYQPSEREGTPGFFTGRLQFTFPNLFGTGRFFEAFWEKKDAHSQSLRLQYEEPWLFGWPLYLGGMLVQDVRDTTYVERQWNLTARYRPWPSLSLGIQLGQRSVLPDSLGSIIYRVPESDSRLLSVGIDYSTLNDARVPRRGVRYSTRFTFGLKENIGPEEILSSENLPGKASMRSIEADAVAVFPLFRNESLFLSLHGREISTGDPYVNLSEQIRFGGTRTLRGYAEDSFRGSLVAWMNTEFRHFLGNRTWIFGFLDTGLYQRQERDRTWVRGWKTGYGLGVRLDTRLGLFGVDFGLGEGDRLMQGKIHVGLINRF